MLTCEAYTATQHMSFHLEYTDMRVGDVGVSACLK